MPLLVRVRKFHLDSEYSTLRISILQHLAGGWRGRTLVALAPFHGRTSSDGQHPILELQRIGKTQTVTRALLYLSLVSLLNLL